MKKIISFILFICISITLCSCSSEDANNSKDKIFLVLRMSEATEKTHRYIVDRSGTLKIEIGESFEKDITVTDFMENSLYYDVIYKEIELTDAEVSFFYILADEIYKQGSYQSDLIIDDSLDMVLSYNGIVISQPFFENMSPAVRACVSEILRLYPMDFGSSDVIVTSKLGLQKK